VEMKQNILYWRHNEPENTILKMKLILVAESVSALNGRADQGFGLDSLDAEIVDSNPA
jgi:hypothetical protein